MQKQRTVLVRILLSVAIGIGLSACSSTESDAPAPDTAAAGAPAVHASTAAAQRVDEPSLEEIQVTGSRVAQEGRTSRQIARAERASAGYAPPASFAFRHSVDVTPLVPVLSAPCNLCQINGAGTYGAKQYHKVSHAVAVDARRVGGEIDNPGLVAAKTLSAMLDVQPMESIPEAHLAIADPEQMARVRF